MVISNSKNKFPSLSGMQRDEVGELTGQWRTAWVETAADSGVVETNLPEVPLASVSEQARLLQSGMESLQGDDPELAGLLDAEVRHQNTTLAMIASASIADPSVLSAGGAALSNVTA